MKNRWGRIGGEESGAGVGGDRNVATVSSEDEFEAPYAG